MKRKPVQQQNVAYTPRPSCEIMIHRACQYPIGDPRDLDFHFCGEPIRPDGRPYCSIHHKLCYIAPEPLGKGKEAAE